MKKGVKFAIEGGKIVCGIGVGVFCSSVVAPFVTGVSVVQKVAVGVGTTVFSSYIQDTLSDYIDSKVSETEETIKEAKDKFEEVINQKGDAVPNES